MPKTREQAVRELDADLGDGREDLHHPRERDGDGARDRDGGGRADRLGRHLGEDEERDRREEHREDDAVPGAEPVGRERRREAEAAERKRFWPIRIVASRREVCAFRFRMMAPRRSPLSRMPCRSMRPSDTSAVSAPAKKPEKTSERRNASTYRTVWE